jgi:hypothetical protein
MPSSRTISANGIEIFLLEQGTCSAAGSCVGRGSIEFALAPGFRTELRNTQIWTATAKAQVPF